MDLEIYDQLTLTTMRRQIPGGHVAVVLFNREGCWAPSVYDSQTFDYVDRNELKVGVKESWRKVHILPYKRAAQLYPDADWYYRCDGGTWHRYDAGDTEFYKPKTYFGYTC